MDIAKELRLVTPEGEFTYTLTGASRDLDDIRNRVEVQGHPAERATPSFSRRSADARPEVKRWPDELPTLMGIMAGCFIVLTMCVVAWTAASL